MTGREDAKPGSARKSPASPDTNSRRLPAHPTAGTPAEPPPSVEVTPRTGVTPHASMTPCAGAGDAGSTGAALIWVTSGAALGHQ